MKPNWNNAPAWANYVALDDDGWWHWFEQKPVWSDSGWMFNGRTLTACNSLQVLPRDSLEPRP